MTNTKTSFLKDLLFRKPTREDSAALRRLRRRKHRAQHRCHALPQSPFPQNSPPQSPKLPQQPVPQSCCSGLSLL